MNGITDDALIQEAARHGVLLSRNDPLLVVLFLHRLILKEYDGLITRQFLEMQAGIEVSNKQQFDHAKQLGEQLASKTVNAMALVGGQMQSEIRETFLSERQALIDLQVKHDKTLRVILISAVIGAGFWTGILSLAWSMLT